jgi:Uma2 family endonuclease
MSTATIQGPVFVSAPSGDEDRYEVIDGQRVGLPPMAIYSSWLASLLDQYLGPFARTHNLGRTVCEGLFHLPEPINRDRRPDLAFVSYVRWAKTRSVPLTDNAWDVVPNLTTEIVSPTDDVNGLIEKVHEYFRAGVELVWVVYPLQREIYVYQSSTQITVLTAADKLDGGTVVPGFRLPLVEFFGEPAQNGVVP